MSPLKRIALVLLLILAFLIFGCIAPRSQGHDTVEEAAAAHPSWIQYEWWQDHPLLTLAGSSAFVAAYIAMLLSGIAAVWVG
jgi:hypothetical protein